MAGRSNRGRQNDDNSLRWNQLRDKAASDSRNAGKPTQSKTQTNTANTQGRSGQTARGTSSGTKTQTNTANTQGRSGQTARGTSAPQNTVKPQSTAPRQNVSMAPPTSGKGFSGGLSATQAMTKGLPAVAPMDALTRAAYIATGNQTAADYRRTAGGLSDNSAAGQMLRDRAGFIRNLSAADQALPDEARNTVAAAKNQYSMLGQNIAQAAQAKAKLGSAGMDTGDIDRYINSARAYQRHLHDVADLARSTQGYTGGVRGDSYNPMQMPDELKDVAADSSHWVNTARGNANDTFDVDENRNLSRTRWQDDTPELLENLRQQLAYADMLERTGNGAQAAEIRARVQEIADAQRLPASWDVRAQDVLASAGNKIAGSLISAGSMAAQATENMTGNVNRSDRAYQLKTALDDANARLRKARVRGDAQAEQKWQSEVERLSLLLYGEQEYDENGNLREEWIDSRVIPAWHGESGVSERGHELLARSARQMAEAKRGLSGEAQYAMDTAAMGLENAPMLGLYAINPVLGSAYMAATVEGQMADSFSHSMDANGNEYNNGMSAQEALLRAAPYAAVETATEALGDSALLDFINKRGSLGLGGVMMRSFLTEGAEETTAGALDYGLDYIYGNPAVRDQSAMEVIGDWLDQGLQGGIIGAALGGTGAVAANRINGQAPQLDPEWWKDVYTGYSSSYSDRLNEGDLRTVQDYVRSLGEEWQRQQTQGERITIPEELYEQRITPEPIAEVQPTAEPQAKPTPAPAPSPAPVQTQNAREGTDTTKTENAQENAPAPAQSAPYNPFAVGGTVQYNGHQYEILETPNEENRNMFKLKNTDGAHGGTLSIPRSEIRRENQNLLRANDELESAPAPVQERAEPAPAAEQAGETDIRLETAEPMARQTAAPELRTDSGLSEQEIEQSMAGIRSAADELGIGRNAAHNEQNAVQNERDAVQQVRQTAPVTLEQAERSMDTIRSIAGNNNFGETGAKAFREGYEIGQDSLEYFRDFSRVYNAVLSGSTRQDTGTLTTAQVKAAVDAARADRAATDEKFSGGTRNRNAGAQYGEWEHRNISPDVRKSLDRLARKLGVSVRFVDELERGGADISGNVVQISRRALESGRNPIEFLVGHEFTHRMQEIAPDAYSEVRRLAQDSADFDRWVERHLAAEPNLTRAEAVDEAVADYVGALLHDERALRRFANAASPNVLQRFIDFLKELRFALSKKERTDAEKAIRILEKAVRAAGKNAKGLSYGSETGSYDREMDAGERHSAVSLFSAISITAERDADTHLITYKDADGNAIEKVTPAMIENSGMGALIKCAVEVGSITQKQAKQQAKDLADVYNLVMQTSDSEMVWEWVGATLFSAMKSNSDAQYSTTVDFSTVCRKTVEMLEAVSAAMQELGRGLSKDEITDIQLKLIEEAKKNGQDPIVPCPVCYVFSRWAGVGGILDNIKRYQEKYPLTMQDAEIHAAIRRLQNSTKADIRNELHEYDAEYRDLEQQNELLAVSLKEARKVRDSLKRDTPERREAARNVNTLAAEKSRVTKQMKAMVDAGTPELAWLQRVRMEQDGLTGNWVTRAGYADEWSGLSAKERDDILFNLMDAESFSQAAPLTWSYRTTRGPSAGKAILPYSDMRIGDIILGVKNSASGKTTFQNVSGELTKDQRKAWKNAISRARAQNLIGGQRYQSTSDFRYDYALDYLQSFFELQAIGGNIQTYTKIIEYADMIGSMGGDANVSVMPLNRGYDEDGNLIFSPVTGVPIEAARAVSERYDSVQPILVGINDEHIRLALESDYITFVIPYHASGASINDFIAKLVSNLDESFNELNYFDYSGNQTDSPAKKPTAAQKRIRDLRTKLLTKPSTEILDADGNQILGKDFKPLKKKWEPSAEDIAFMREMADSAKSIRGRSYEKLREIEKKALGGNRKAIEEYLSWSAGSLWDIYQRLWDTDYYRGVSLSSAQAKSIMPHEYWDRKSKIGNAHINGFIFRSYCFSMGITPRFSTELTKNYVDENGDKQSVKYGDLSQYPGYWKVLIDRAMYDLKGNYRDQNAINLTGFDKARLTPDYNRQGYLSELPTVQEPDSSRASRAAERFVEENRRNSAVDFADVQSVEEPDVGTHEKITDAGRNAFLNAYESAIGQVREKGSWSGAGIREFYRKYPNYDFIARFAAKDKSADEDLVALLDTINDLDTLYGIKWYMVRAKYKANASGVKKFIRHVDNRYNEIAKSKYGGENLGMKDGRYTTENAVEWFDMLNEDEFVKDIAYRVFDTLENNGVEIEVVLRKGSLKKGVAGKSYGGIVILDTDYMNDPAIPNQKKAGTIVHEYIHAATVYAIWHYEHGKPLPAKLRDAAIELQQIYDNLIQVSAEEGVLWDSNGKYTMYGYTSSMEMISELANPEFVERLEQTSLLDRIINAIAKLFGIERESVSRNSRDATLDALERFLTEFDSDTFGRYADLADRQAERKGVKYLVRNGNSGRNSGVDYADILGSSTEEMDSRYMAAVESGDMETAQEMVNARANAVLNTMLLPDDSDEAGFKYHRGPAPTKTFKRYAVFNVSEDGFRAAYAGNANPTPVGVWIDAQNLRSYLSDVTQFADGTFASYIPGDTGFSFDDKFSPELKERMVAEYGLKRGQRFLLERGGKHSSDWPNFSQMNLKQDENGNKVRSAKDGALPHNKLIFEIEYGVSDDGDLTEFVRENGRIDAMGRNQGIAKIGPNQFYDFKTNPNAVGNWGIGGTFRIVRLVPYSEVVSKTEELRARDIQAAKDAYERGEIKKSDMTKRIKSAESVITQKWVGGYHPEDFDLSVESVDEMAAEGRKMKLLDPVTYDDNGNPIPLSQRFNADVEDVRYSGVDYADLIEQYGSIKPGENPARDIKVPRRTSKDEKVSQSIRTMLESAITTEEMIPTIQKLVEDGEFSYPEYTDKRAVMDAEKKIADKDSAWEAYADWSREVREGKVSKDLTAQSLALYNAAATSGDGKLAALVMSDLASHERRAGQAVQAMRILKKLSPSAQLYGVQKQIENMNSDLQERHGFAAKNKKRQRKVDESLDELEKRRDSLLDEIRQLEGKLKRKKKKGGEIQKDDLPGEVADVFERQSKRRKAAKKGGSAQEEVPQGDWIESVANALEEAMYKRTQPPARARQEDIEKTVLKDLIAFADNYVSRPKSAKKPRTAVDRIRDFFTYRTEYARAWNMAVQKYREDHGGESAAMDAMEAWLDGTISYAGQGTDKVMLAAVAQAALTGDIELNNLLRRVAFGDRAAVEEEIYSRLFAAIGRPAQGSEQQLRGAVSRWVQEQMSRKPVNLERIIREAATSNGMSVADIVRNAKMGDARVLEDSITEAVKAQLGITDDSGGIVRDMVHGWLGARVAEKSYTENNLDIQNMLQNQMERAVRDAGTSISELIRSGKKGRDAIGRTITRELVKSYGLSDISAAHISGMVLDMYNETLAARAREALESRFRSPDDRRHIQTTISDRLAELGNLGAFSDPDFRTQASNKILMGEYNIDLNEALVDKFLAASSQSERDDILKEIYIDAGRQMPATLEDKFNALCYLSMLLNFRTHNRNVSGNLGFMPVIMAKNLLATAVETVAPIEHKTKGVPTPALIKAAWEDYENARPMILKGGKWQDTDTLNEYMQEGRRIFKSPVLEFLRRGNGELLDKEDSFAARPHYAVALAQYCAANKITPEMIRTGEGITVDEMDRAKAYAIQEAAKATFRDTNQFSEFISAVGKYQGDNVFRKGMSSLMYGMLPFRKTPANIAVRAVEYSPLGVFRALGHLVSAVRTGNVEPAQVIDEFASVATGTIIFKVGGYLAYMGILKAAADDDDDAMDKFLKDIGHQEWSIEVDGESKTIDWLAPECIPLLMGANMAQHTMEGGGKLEAFLNAANSISEPFLEMSMLSSVQDTIDSVRGWDTGNASSLVTVAANMALNRLTQAIPTLFGQAERASQETRMANWSKTGSTLSVAGREIELPDFLPDDWKYVIAKNSAKIPGIDFNQYEYVDVWGRAQSNGGFLARIVNNFINPAYVRKIDDDAVNAYIENLYPAGKEVGVNVIPTRAAYKITVDGEDIELDKDQYHTYAVSAGQNRFSLVQTAMADKAFMALPDTEQAEIIGKLYSYADYLGKLDVLPKEQRDTLIAKTSEGSNKWLTQAQDAQKAGISPIALVMVRNAVNNVSGWHDSKGNAVSNSAGLQQMDAINKAFSSTNAREWAYDNVGDIGKTIRGYNPARVQDELAKARKRAVDAG